MRKLLDVLITCLAIIISILTFFAIMKEERFAGIIMLGLAFIILGLGRIQGVRIKQVLPDITFGALDTGLMVIFAIIGGIFGGFFGAIIGAGLGDAITEAVAGFFEGTIAEKLRSLGIEESRTAIRAALGKMSGCLFGASTCTLLAQFLAII